MGGRSFLKWLWLKLFISCFSKIITWHATSDQEYLNIFSKFPQARIVVIPNGINAKQFCNYSNITRFELVSRYASINYKPSHVIISMGRLHKKKGFDILIDSFALTLNKFPNAVLLIAGSDNGEGKALQHKIDGLRLFNNIFLVGDIQGKDKVDFFANADLFILPSHDENFGNVYAESLAAGTPIIASTYTPWKDVNTYNCGKWVNNSIEETANATMDLLNSNLIEMGQNGKRYIEESFSWESVAFQFEKAFKRMILANRGNIYNA